MIVKEKLLVETEPESIRLEAYCLGKFQTITTRKGVKKAIKRGEILLNGQPGQGSVFVKQGDLIEVVEPESGKGFKVFPIDLDVVYEDEWYAVINKPPGYPVSGNYFKTIEHALPHNLEPSVAKDALPFPLPCHRLDSSTSGCLLIAKTREARVKAGELFEKGQVNKIYHAIVVGEKVSDGYLKFLINEKESLSSVKKITSSPSLSNEAVHLVELIPFTGRTHQLRIHCAEAGHPILGDPLYGTPKARLKGKGLFLASTQLSFIHPFLHKQLVVSVPVPAKFTRFMENEKRRFEKFTSEKGNVN